MNVRINFIARDGHVEDCEDASQQTCSKFNGQSDQITIRPRKFDFVKNFNLHTLSYLCDTFAPIATIQRSVESIRSNACEKRSQQK